MNEYPKIQSVFKRDEKTHKFIIGDWTLPEFEYLADVPWLWTEKVDGTNIRINWGDGRPIQYGGRTDNAQIPAKLVNALDELFQPYARGAFSKWTPPKEYGEKRFSEIFKAAEDVTLYGEGYGAGIQKGGGNYSQEQKFILFDVKIGNWWLQREDVEDIAIKLGLDIVPVWDRVSITEMLSDFYAGYPMSAWDNVEMEGVVGHPLVELRTRRGDRIMTKIKGKDF